MTPGCAPYRRIQRLRRARLVLIASEAELHTGPYDPLAGGAEPMPAEQQHTFLRQGLIDHLRQALAGPGGPIGFEHSSGLDSNAVLGALSGVRAHLPGFEATWQERQQVILNGRSVPTLSLRHAFVHAGLHAASDRWMDLRQRVDICRLARGLPQSPPSRLTRPPRLGADGPWHSGRLQ